MIAGNNVSKVTVRDLHLTRSTPGAMQGFVTEVRKGEIVLDMPPGKVFRTSLLIHFYLSILRVPHTSRGPQWTRD